MKKLRQTLVLAVMAVLVFSCAKEDKTAYKIVIDSGQVFPEGAQLDLITLKTVESPDRVDVIAERVLGKDGKITIQGTTTEVYMVHIGVRSPDGEENLSKLSFPLEPGTTNISFTAPMDYKVTGGQYVTKVISSWNNDAGYKKAKKELMDFNITDFKDTEQRAIWSKLNGKLIELQAEIQKRVIDQTDDPIVKLLVYDSGYFGDPRVDLNATIENLVAQIDPESHIAKTSMIGVKFRRAAAAAENNVGVGAVIKDFTAEDLKGNEFHLADVLKNNKYVLVEFWASWCGPCRAEIPHMKKAYSHFRDKGFEIVSFTLDDKRERWEKASKEDGIPWIDTGDLLAYTSPVTKMYGVTAVPANYLVDASTGTIVAQNLRQEKLDNKLAELFQ